MNNQHSRSIFFVVMFAIVFSTSSFLLAAHGLASSIGFAPSEPTVVSALDRACSCGGIIHNMVGYQQIVETTVTSYSDIEESIVILIEIRDSVGVTMSINWQDIEIAASGQAPMGVSWTPVSADTYEVRTFVLSNLDNPLILSDMKTTNVVIR